MLYVPKLYSIVNDIKKKVCTSSPFFDRESLPPVSKEKWRLIFFSLPWYLTWMGTFRTVQFYREEKQITNFTSHWQKYFEALTFVQILDPSMKKPSSVNRLNAGSVLVILKLSNKICKDGLGKHECQKMQSCFNTNRQSKYFITISN